MRNTRVNDRCPDRVPFTRLPYCHCQGIRRVVLSKAVWGYALLAEGVGCDENWGDVPVTPHATGSDSRRPAGFLAHYDFGFADLTLVANENKGLLIIASYMRFCGGSGRSNYFTLEFFYHDTAGSAAP
jgi:hypothetical protein